MQAGAERAESLGPAAMAGLRKSWERGNAAGAIEVLRSLGVLKPPTAELLDIGDRDLNAELTATVGNMAASARRGAPTGKPPVWMIPPVS